MAAKLVGYHIEFFIFPYFVSLSEKYFLCAHLELKKNMCTKFEGLKTCRFLDHLNSESVSQIWVS
jgi:hypothetical protein